MRTIKAYAHYDHNKLHYPTDLTDQELMLVEPAIHLPSGAATSVWLTCARW